MDSNYTGGVMAISALIVAGIAHLFGTNIEVASVAQVIFGIIAIVGMVKQMIDHKKQGTVLAAVIANK